MSLKQKGLQVLRNYLYRRRRKAARQFRKVNRSFLRSIMRPADPIAEAVAITDRRSDDEWKQLQPVWVLSTGRTGTNSLAELLNRSPLVDARHEPAPELFAFSRDYYNGDISRQQALQSLKYLRDELVFRSFRDGFIYTETNNRLVYIAELLLELYPQSKFIFIHRNPYQFVRSGMRRGYYDGHLRDYARIAPGTADNYAGKWEAMTKIEKVAWNWKAVNELCLNFIEKLPTKQHMSFSSEELFTVRAPLVNDLFDFAGSSNYRPPTAVVERVMGQKHNAQQQGTFSKSEDWMAKQIEKVNQIIAPVARQLEYSLLSAKNDKS